MSKQSEWKSSPLVVGVDRYLILEIRGGGIKKRSIGLQALESKMQGSTEEEYPSLKHLKQNPPE